MIETIMFFIHGACLLVFGVILSAALTRIELSKKNICILLAFVFVCGILQIAAMLIGGESGIWMIYPLITHLPLVLLFTLGYKKRLSSSLAAVLTAYLLCQPANWCGLVIEQVIGSEALDIAIQCLVLAAVAAVTIKYLAPYLSEIFNKETRDICIFASMPAVYYVFDYGTGIYSDLWTENNRIASEFLALFLGIAFVVFCVVYQREYEEKVDVERRNQIISITAKQRMREMEAVKRSEQEIKILRHDMRLHLSSIALCIDNGEIEKAKELIDAYSTHIDGTMIKRYCSNEMINYIFSDYASKFEDANISFEHSVEIGKIQTDEMLFASIVSNALDNALNAQMKLPEDVREVDITLKEANGKLMMSVENPVAVVPEFIDGMPVSRKEGHGYGTQSIKYTSERLGGNCRFEMKDKKFITRVII